MNIDFSETTIEQFITHHIGNKQREESIALSEKEVSVSDETKEHLLNYFLVPMKKDEVYCFTHTVDVQQNDIYTLINELFNDKELFIEHSHNMGKLLYEATTHPKANAGEMNIVLLLSLIHI